MTKGVKEPARLNGQAEEWIPVRHETEDEVVGHNLFLTTPAEYLCSLSQILLCNSVTRNKIHEKAKVFKPENCVKNLRMCFNCSQKKLLNIVFIKHSSLQE